MTDADLDRLIEEGAQWNCPQRMAAALRELRESQRPIPVTERLPEVWAAVLVFDLDAGWVQGHLSNLGSIRLMWYDVRGFILDEPTHWLPLPAPPREATE